MTTSSPTLMSVPDSYCLLPKYNTSNMNDKSDLEDNSGLIFGDTEDSRGCKSVATCASVGKVTHPSDQYTCMQANGKITENVMVQGISIMLIDAIIQ